MIEIWKDIPDYEGFYQISNLGRSSVEYGIKSPHSKFTDKDLQDIRFLLNNSESSQQEIADKYGVYQTTISRIKLNKTYIN